MKTFTKEQIVRVTRQENSEFWTLGEDTMLAVYVGVTNDPEDAPYVHVVDVRSGQVHIVSDAEIEAT